MPNFRRFRFTVRPGTCTNGDLYQRLSHLSFIRRLPVRPGTDCHIALVCRASIVPFAHRWWLCPGLGNDAAYATRKCGPLEKLAAAR